MPDLVAYGRVKGGVFKVENRPSLEAGISVLPEGDYAMTLTKIRPLKSRQLEKWLHGVAITMIASETGNDPKDVFEFFKLKFRPTPMFIGDEMVMVGRSTSGSRMTLEEQQDFKEKIQAWAAEFLNINIPDPLEAEEE